MMKIVNARWRGFGSGFYDDFEPCGSLIVLSVGVNMPNGLCVLVYACILAEFLGIGCRRCKLLAQSVFPR